MPIQIPDIVFPIIALTIAIVIALYSWRRSRSVAIIAVGWAILSLFTAQIPYFQSIEAWSDSDMLGYNVFSLAMVFPVIILLIALWRSEHFRQFMHDTPIWVLTASQLYRIAGASLLIFYWQGLLPAEIGLSNGVQDIIIGLTALPLAWMLYRGFSWSRPVAIVWNVAGLFDFISAGMVLTLSILGEINLTPIPTRMGLYPLSLISLYQVPVAIFIHIYLLQRLFRGDSEG
ncbi:MAG: hypothetical protein AAF846_01535 [Chloroflexota bacterium]